MISKNDIYLDVKVVKGSYTFLLFEYLETAGKGFPHIHIELYLLYINTIVLLLCCYVL